MTTTSVERPKHPGGRPPLGVEKLTVYLTHEQMDYVYGIADLENRPASRVVRELVALAISTHSRGQARVRP